MKKKQVDHNLVFATSCDLNSPDITSARSSSANRSEPVALYLCFAIVLECWQFVGIQNLACFAEQTPPVIVIRSNACASDLGGFFRTLRKAVATLTWLNSAAFDETKSHSPLVSLILITCLLSSMWNCLLGRCLLLSLIH
jgi:hypothetical protein